MADYINQEDVYQYLDNEVEWKVNQDRLYALEVINDFPTADVAEVRHGRWEEASDGDGIVCSECRTDFCTMIHETEKFNYCPNCGALMMEAEHDG